MRNPYKTDSTGDLWAKLTRVHKIKNSPRIDTHLLARFVQTSNVIKSKQNSENSYVKTATNKQGRMDC